jgi:type IV pilus assembly protein PilY1
MGCCRAGCTLVDATTEHNYGACGFGSHFKCEAGKYFRDATNTNVTPAVTTCSGAVSCGASPGNAFTASVKLTFQCPGAASSTVTAATSCGQDGTCSSFAPVGGGHDVNGTFSNACNKSRFYGLWAYGRHATKMFNDLDTARTFERNRFTDVPFTGCGAAPGGSCSLVDTTQAAVTTAADDPTCGGGVAKCAATVDDAGWFYEYGSVCPATSCPGAGGCNHEKTGSNPAVVLGCANWNSLQPASSQTGADPCTGTIGTPVSFTYLSDFVTGVPTTACGFSQPAPATTVYRAKVAPVIGDPPPPIPRLVVSPTGEISYSALDMPAGAPPSSTTMGVRSDVSEPVYWLEVPREVHRCRHDAATAAMACQ